MPKTTVTAALPYANGPVHIGHVAGVYLPADIYVRYLRNAGKEVMFICGSDEHGVPITLRAKKEGTTPQAVVDKFHNIIGKSFKDLGISFDVYSRTSSLIHHQTAQDFFKNLYEKNVFSEATTEQYYDEEAKQFLADRYILGTCPVCANENAYGDQCEKCGSTLSPTELINPRSALSGNAPIKRPTKNWYLPLDKMQVEFLQDWLLSKTNWKTNVVGQCKSWLADGLKPRAMTRDLEWGVPVPIENTDGKVLYVWFEAPIGYISATRERLPNSWEDWWKGDAELVHFIGKDNIVFHCIIFPAMLHARGDGFVLPKNVPGNEFLNLEGNKISTSRNWAVWLHEYLEFFPEKQDELRYVLGSIIPETKDSEFTWKDYQQRVNSELVGILGNFANRVLVLINKYYNGITPDFNRENLTAQLQTSMDNCENEMLLAKGKMLASLQDFRFRDALAEMMNIARAGNKYLTETEPWKLIKSDEKNTASVLHYALKVLKNITLSCEPFLPFTHQKLCAQLNYLALELEVNQFWNSDKLSVGIPANHKIGEVGLLFQKIEDDSIEKQIDKLKNMQVTTNESSSEPAPEKIENTFISFDDFTKMALKVAKIVAAEKVEKADKLYKLRLDLGSEQRTVLSGIAQYYSLEELIGKQVVLLANLAPRTMRGIESQGMILMADGPDGKPIILSPETAVDNGSNIR